MQNLPKSDVRLVITIAVLLLSFLLRNIQFQKYERAVKFLKTATLGNLGPKNGGTKQTQELYKRATERYENYLKEGNA